MSRISIDPVAPAEADLLLGFARDFHLEEGRPLDPAAERVIRSVAAGDPMAPTWIIREDGVAVGYVALSQGHSIASGGPDGFIDDLYLVPEARGRGIGQAVLGFVEAEARRRGWRAMHLEVEVVNSRAQRSYARFGFAPSPRKLMTKALE